MKQSESANRTSTWLKPLLLIALATLITTGCKESAVQAPSGGSPSSGGSSGGGAPPPPGGGSSGGGMPPPGGGSSGGGAPSPGGSSGEGPSSGSPGGQSGDSSGGSGDVGSVPPPPGQQGGGGDLGGGESGGGDPSGGQTGDAGGGEENPFGDSEGDEGESDCGDTGAMPGGIGGMGREGECISGGESASESDSESEASSGGGASGGGSSGGGSSGGGSSGGSSGESGTGGAGSVGEFPEESAEERAARLGRELDESIGGFDETLGEEQREIAAAGRVVDGFDTDGGGEGSGGTISLGSQTAPTYPDGGMPGTGSGVQTSPIAGMSQEQIEERTPDDVPTMVDDDIIARQLREAALVEQDPALRARLWDEYRKYKGLLVAD